MEFLDEAELIINNWLLITLWSYSFGGALSEGGIEWQGGKKKTTEKTPSKILECGAIYIS